MRERNFILSECNPRMLKEELNEIQDAKSEQIQYDYEYKTAKDYTEPHFECPQSEGASSIAALGIIQNQAVCKDPQIRARVIVCQGMRKISTQPAEGQ